MSGLENLWSEQSVVVDFSLSGDRGSIGERRSTFHADQATGFLSIRHPFIFDHAAVCAGGIGWRFVLAGRLTGLRNLHHLPPEE
jgi:hypothetical protein